MKFKDVLLRMNLHESIYVTIEVHGIMFEAEIRSVAEWSKRTDFLQKQVNRITCSNGHVEVVLK